MHKQHAIFAVTGKNRKEFYCIKLDFLDTIPSRKDTKFNDTEKGKSISTFGFIFASIPTKVSTFIDYLLKSCLSALESSATSSTVYSVFLSGGTFLFSNGHQ